MAHELTETDHMFSASRLTPWHGLGTVVEEAPNSAKAIELAGLDWEVRQSGFTYSDGTTDREVPGMKVNYRSDNGDSLGVVSDWYNIVQNKEAFEFTDHLIGEGAAYETAGSIKGGRQVWLLARLPEQKILDDEVFPYLLFANGHDGKTAVQVCMTPVRVVCNNTLNLALGSAARKWSLSHFKSIHGKLTDAQRTLRLAGDYMKTLEKKAEAMAVKKLARNAVRNFVAKMFPAEDTDRKNERVKKDIERFHECYGAYDIENFKGTQWGLILAVSDFVTHKPLKQERQRETHFINTIAGSEVLDRAFNLISSI